MRVKWELGDRSQEDGGIEDSGWRIAEGWRGAKSRKERLRG